MSFFLTLLYISLYCIRPFEFSSALQHIFLLPVTGAVAFVCVCFSKYNSKYMFKNGTDQLIVGYIIAIALSRLRHAWFGGALDAVVMFLPSFLGYFLVAYSIQTKKQLNAFLYMLTFIASFVAVEGIREYYAGVSYCGVVPIVEYAKDITGNIRSISRIIWLGVFSDPNDLAMLLLVPVPVMVNRFLERKSMLPLFFLGLLLYGVYLTNSRGGILATCFSILCYFILRQKNTKGLLFGIVVISIVLIFGPSRMSSLSAGGESAQGRLDAWYTGFQMFIEYPFFGVGQGLFVDYNQLTAHNSFVLVLGELGLFGAFFFTGLFVIPFRFCYYYLWGDQRVVLSKTDIGKCSSIYAALVGVMSAMFFLSRSYMLIPFMMIGLCTATSRLYRNEGLPDENLDSIPSKWIAIIMISFIIGIRVLVKLFL